MNSREIAYRRLHHQRLRGTPWRIPEDAVRGLVAVHAPAFAYARWSVAQRRGSSRRTPFWPRGRPKPGRSTPTRRWSS